VSVDTVVTGQHGGHARHTAGGESIVVQVQVAAVTVLYEFCHWQAAAHDIGTMSHSARH
jgi:hypothetical protein